MRLIFLKQYFPDFIKSNLKALIPIAFAIGLTIFFLYYSKPRDKYGSVYVSSEPAGIPIMIDGAKSIFTTDTTISEVKTGVRRISLFLVNGVCEPHFINVDVKENQVARAHFKVQFFTNSTNVNREPRLKDFPKPAPITRDENKSQQNIINPIIVPKKTYQKGNIQISCNEQGADIHINGQATGLKTPAIITNLDPGTYQISVYKQGYTSYPEIASVNLDEDVGIAYTHFELISKIKQENKILLVVLTDPPITNLLINGKNEGNTPFRKLFPKGRYKIEFPKITGYLTPQPRQIRLQDQDSLVVELKYQKVTGKSYLAIYSPKSAELINLGKLKIEIDRAPFFNGAAVESRHIILGSVPEGEHLITIFFDNLSADITVSFINGHVTPIELKFERFLTQVKPKLRPFEPQKYEDYRQLVGQVTYYP
ncbi:MAG: PEGA domain-containing protein [bacterium]|nr:PEGA domain-containing protein [bacterium]